MPGLLVDSDQAVASWCHSTFNVYPLPVNRAIGVLDKQANLVGAILFQNFNGVNLEISYYGVRTLTVGIVRLIARIAIAEFNAARLTAISSRRNKRLIKSLIKIGFRLEGMQRCFYGHLDNKKNTGVRLVAFREELSRVAFRTITPKKDAIQ